MRLQSTVVCCLLRLRRRLQIMSRPTLANHPAVSFTVKRPSALSRETPQSGADASFPVPVSITRPSSKPTPLPPGGGGRRLASNSHDNDDSSDEDAGTEDEIITGFDSFGVQRCVNFVTLVPKNDNLNSHSDML